MGSAARYPHSDDATPQSSPPVVSTTFDASPESYTLSETIEILWDDDDEQQTLRLVTDADRTLKLDEQFVDIEGAIATLVDDAEEELEALHPITASITNKLSERWYDDSPAQPQPLRRSSLPRHDAVVSKTPSWLVVLVAFLGYLLGVGLTILAFLVAPEVRGLLPPERPVQEAQQTAPDVPAATAPSTIEHPPPLPSATERSEELTETPASDEIAEEPRSTDPDQAVDRPSNSIPDELVLPITFHSGRHRISSSDTEALRALAKAMIAAPRTRFDIVGYALPNETEGRSQARHLAARRARAARDIIRALGPSKRRLSPRAARYQEPLLVDQPAGEPHQAVILRVTRR